MAASCPKCGAAVAPEEKFCSACGAGIAIEPAGPGIYQGPAPAALQASAIDRDASIRRARKWLVAVSILTLVTGFIFFAIQKSDVEDQIRQAEHATAGMDPAVRDEAMKAKIGMTFQQAVDHDRGQVNMLLAVNIGLAAFYLGMWFWAKRNARAATVTALLMFVTVIVINAALDPKTLAQGIIVKILFIAALAKAIQHAREAPPAATTP
jgi:hypothetical protein